MHVKDFDDFGQDAIDLLNAPAPDPDAARAIIQNPVGPRVVAAPVTVVPRITLPAPRPLTPTPIRSISSLIAAARAGTLPPRGVASFATRTRPMIRPFRWAPVPPRPPVPVAVVAPPAAVPSASDAAEAALVGAGAAGGSTANATRAPRAAGGSLAAPAAGAVGGFLVAGPVGAIAGAAAGWFLGRRKAVGG